MITISKKEYDALVESDLWLTYLEGAGLDNWIGFDIARENWREDGHGNDD